ncbi:MAG: class I SAM-dependent methyltransferase [Myxococcota bacterium]
MSTERQTEAYYDDFSGWYERERARGYHALVDELEVRAVAPLARGRRVLEVGCGTGLVLERLAPIAEAAYGVDLSAGMLRKARERGLPVVQGSVTALPFADDSFDLVCSFKVLAHVHDIDRALSELVRVTRPGGYLALEFYNPWSVRHVAKKIAGPQPISEGRSEADVFTRWDSPRRVRKLLPTNVELVDFRGVRVLTPAAFTHRIPGLRQALAWGERAALTSPLRRFGGFLIAVARKQDQRI